MEGHAVRDHERYMSITLGSLAEESLALLAGIFGKLRDGDGGAAL